MNLASYLRHAIPSWWTLASAPRPKGRIAVLGTVWSHHAKRSGYHPVAKGVGLLIPAQGMQLSPATLSRWIAGEGLERAHQIAVAMKLMRRDRLLVIDGDSEMKLVEELRRLTSARIYAVFHQVTKVLEKAVRDSPPGLLEGALCVARCQLPLVQPLAPPGRTWFVPHGIDTEFFSPREPRSERPSVLCVGYHYRDFETLRESAELILQAVPNAVVRLIAPRWLLSPSLNLGRVELLSGLSDDALVAAYREAWVALLPLTDSTANNSLLEAMACGTPVVVTDVGGVRDYAGPECGALFPPGDARAGAAATIALLGDRSRRAAAGRSALARAQACAWPSVRQRVRELLDGDGAS